MSARDGLGPDEFTTRMERLAELIEAVEHCEPAAQAPARELVRALLDVHESGLRALLSGLRSAAGTHADAWLATACAEPSVTALLQMHDLPPAPPLAAEPAPTRQPPREREGGEQLIPASRLIARIGGGER